MKTKNGVIHSITIGGQEVPIDNIVRVDFPPMENPFGTTSEIGDRYRFVPSPMIGKAIRVVTKIGPDVYSGGDRKWLEELDAKLESRPCPQCNGTGKI